MASEVSQPEGPVDSSSADQALILGTAGHIDHGKTTLVKALTGTDTDRLPQEKLRGMTIELGFAALDIEDSLGRVRFGIVDVPGHERFVRTMVSGASGIDMVMLVVAADDSVMPQTTEHVDILNLLGVSHGVVAVTKCDAVDEDMVALVTEEIVALLAPTPMRSFPIVPVSAVTGFGLEELRGALSAQARAIQARQSSSVFRVAIDRVFTIHGRGTVVTGSAQSGSVTEGQDLELLPAGLKCKVRGLQTHFDQVDRLQVGERVAINVTGIDKQQIQRGDELATPGYLTPTRVLDVQLSALAGNARPLKHLQRLRLCIGTRECHTQLRLFGRRQLAPGESGPAQLQSATPLVAAYGQRFIVRDESDSLTLGGGLVLRPVSRKLTSRDALDIAALDALSNGNELDRLAEAMRFQYAAHPPTSPADVLLWSNRAGIEPEAVTERLDALHNDQRLIRLADDLLVPGSLLDGCRRQALDRLRRYHQRHPDDPGMPKDALYGWLQRRWGAAIGEHVLSELTKAEIRLLGRFCCLAQFAPQMSAEEEQALAAVVQEYWAAAYQPPAAAALVCAKRLEKRKLNKLLKIATASGQLVQITPDIILHAQHLEDLKQKLAQHLDQSEGLTIAEVRTLIDSSRKFVVPLMEYLDKTGFTRRQGDVRVLVQD